MSAIDINPAKKVVTQISPFKHWVQTVLPTVYDDSLSYMELLNKVTKYLNNVIEAVNALGENSEALYSAFNQLKEYVDNYFNQLDVSAEVRAKLDEMAEDGTLTRMLEPILAETIRTDVNAWLVEHIDELGIDEKVSSKIEQMAADGSLSEVIKPAVADKVGDAVTEWLDENVTPTGSMVMVDKTLTIDGAGADAKVVGDEVRGLADGLNSVQESVEELNTEMDGKVDKNRGDLNYGVLGIRNGQVVNDTWPEVIGLSTHAGLAGNGVSFALEDGRRIRMWGAFPGRLPVVGFMSENVDDNRDVYITGVADPMTDTGVVNLRTMNRALESKLDDQPGPLFANKYLAVNDDGRISYVPAPESGLTPEQLANIGKIPEKMVKRIAYMGEDRVIRDYKTREPLVIPYNELVQHMLNYPDFVVIVDSTNRVYHPELITDEQVVFTSVYPMDGYLRVNRITVSNRNLVTTSSFIGESKANKVVFIQPTGAAKDVEQFPTVSAIRDYAEAKSNKQDAYAGMPGKGDPTAMDKYPSLSWIRQMMDEQVGTIDTALGTMVERAEEVAE